MNKFKTTLLVIIFLSFNIYAQEEIENNEEPKNQLTFVFGYTHIPDAYEEGKLNESVFVPTTVGVAGASTTVNVPPDVNVCIV